MRKKVNRFWIDFEKFHDTHRYFTPLVFISIILMVFGINYLGPTSVVNHFNLQGPVLFKDDSVVLALTLRPGWIFVADVVTSRPIEIELIDMNGNVINSSLRTNLVAKINQLDYYLLRLKGSNYALLSLNYMIAGLVPSPIEFSLFGGGLIILLLTLIYYYLAPFKINLKNHFKSRIDGVFYPLMVFLSAIVFWIFRNFLMLVVPKDSTSVIIHSVVITLLIAFFAFVITKLKLNPVKKYIFSYLMTYFVLYLILLLTYAGVIRNYFTVIVNFIFLIALLFISYKAKCRVSACYFMLFWLVSILLNFASYVIGVPYTFSNLLTVPNESGTLFLLLIVELFTVSSIYFLIRGYFNKSLDAAFENGLYAAILFQGVLQAVLVTNVML